MKGGGIMMKNKTLITCMIFFAISLALSEGTYAQEERLKGEINWVGGYISGVGYATATPTGNKAKDRLSVLRAAEVMAQRALVETIQGVRIDSETIVENMMLRDDVVRSRVQGVIKGAQIVSRNVEWIDGAPLGTVEMRVCMTATAPGCKSPNSLMGILPVEHKKEPVHAPAQNFTSKPLPPETEKKDETAKPEVQAAESRKPAIISYDSTKPVTGIVINLEGKYFERELLPIVVTEGEGGAYLTVYSAKNVKPPVIRTYGVVRYADSIEHAVKIQYIGNNIIVIPAMTVTRENMIVIPVEDAKLVRETTRHGNDYLGDAKVVISSR